MANNQQIIIEEGVSIDGEVTVDGVDELITLEQQTVLNTQILNNILEEIVKTNKLLTKIYNPE